MAIISNGTTIANAGAFSVNLGSMVLIKSLTASSSGNLSFVNGASSVVLDSTYPVYKIEFINIHPQTDAQHLGFQVSTNSGSSYGVAITSTLFRGYHNEGGSASGVAYREDYDMAQSTSIVPLSDGIATGSDNDQCVSGSILLFDLSSTTFVKHFIVEFQEAHQLEYSIHGFVGGHINTTSAVNAIKFSMSSGNIDAGKIKLYGIKDS